MLRLKMLNKFVLVSVLMLSSFAFAISEELKAVVDWETGANAVAMRSNEMVKIEHYEIPLRLLNFDIDRDIAQSTRDSLVFMKEGEKYVRWVINPEDTKWHLEIAKFLETHGVSSKKHQFFEAYKTASRSYIVVNPENKAEFSAKVSTDVTGGNWTDKKQSYEDATQIRMIMKHINAQIRKTGQLKRSVLLDEPAIFGIKSLDQGMVIRAYDGIAGTGNKYLPGFSAVHDRVGRSIALQNGSKDPAKFWNENYNKPLARALAEFIAATGVAYDSPHSQNFLVELDKHNKPTGRIVLRDFGDSYVNEKFMDAIGKSFIATKWEKSNIVKSIHADVGILHGNKAPTWLSTDSISLTSSNSYNKWGADFYREFRKEFTKQTGFMLNSLRSSAGAVTHSRDGLYFADAFSLNDVVGEKFIEMVKASSQRDNFRSFYCQRIFAP